MNYLNKKQLAFDLHKTICVGPLHGSWRLNSVKEIENKFFITLKILIEA